jgi:hypothetical protein
MTHRSGTPDQTGRRHAAGCAALYAGAVRCPVCEPATTTPRACRACPSSIRPCGSWATRPGSPSGSCCARPAVSSRPATPTDSACWRAATTGSTRTGGAPHALDARPAGAGAMKTYCHEVLDRCSTSWRASRTTTRALSLPPGAGARRHARRGAAVHDADAGAGRCNPAHGVGDDAGAAPAGEIAFRAARCLRGGDAVARLRVRQRAGRRPLIRGAVRDRRLAGVECRYLAFVDDGGYQDARTGARRAGPG